MGLSEEEVDAALAEGGDNVPKTVDGKVNTQPRVMPEQARERREILSQLLQAGVSPDMIAQAMAEKFGMDEAAVKRLSTEIRQRWLEEDDEDRPYARSATIRRLKKQISEARAKGAYTAAAMYEKTLAGIEGTANPVELHIKGDIRVSQAVRAVIGEMDETEFMDLVNEESGRFIEADYHESDENKE